jgi:hypothetical protein
MTKQSPLTPDELPQGIRTDLALAAASAAMSLVALIFLVIG